MGRRLQHLTGEAVKFSAVNVVATVIALVIFNALVHGIKGVYDGPLHARPLSTYVLANTVGMVVSYVGTRRYAFKHRPPIGPGEGALNYALVNYASFVIPISCLWVNRNVLGWDNALADNISGNIIGAVLGMVFRFWAFRRFVFAAAKPVTSGQHAAGSHAGSHAGPLAVLSSAGPEVGPHVAELVEHQPQQGQAQPDDVVRVAGHPAHKRTAEAVEGEGAGDGERLAGGDVGVDLFVADGGEPNLGAR